MATITEDYCSREIYRLLIEKGFDGEIHTTFDEEGYTQASITLQMAMKWLREVHKCYITFTWEFKEYDKSYKPIYKDITWSFNIAIPKYNSARKDDGDYFDLDSDKEYDSYEEACEVAIKYCLENLI